MAEAIQKNATHVITSGAAGSNHARATATYASLAKLHCTLMLFDQKSSPAVRENLLADRKFNAHMYLDSTYEQHAEHCKERMLAITQDEHNPPYLIPAGGSSPTGTIGFVNAGFELAQQIQAGILPIPESIFITFGTMGTAAGLLLGLRASGISSTVHAIRVVPDFVGNYDKCIDLFEKTNKILHDADSSFPVINPRSTDLIVSGSYFGNGYAVPLKQAEDCISLLQKSDNIKLDSVYTGKCGAAFLEYCSNSSNTGTVLFWNTKNSHTAIFSESELNFKKLPESFHKYFVE